ncbi:hypothetical protein H8F21_15135 [Pseudomonas sp. P66]|uniref:Uncharacterized protein n=1 Tax=Pseudomonas arcuscaelestis TaxID=2710591 RepID=A0ABS2C1F8_9PSED|nr:hypothetical protein [Pseudomonas arcuscaelestis]MBM5458899.1 hypothetical protein [Pseudomonas arcuscaelestis]
MREAIAAVISGILTSADDESVLAFKGLADSEHFIELDEQITARCPDEFGLYLATGHMKAVDGLLHERLGGNSRARFLFRHGAFVEGHVRKRIERAEGYSCSADKTRTVLRSLARHLIDGVPIVFDHSGETTFHLPLKILTTESEVVSFYDALHRLYYGNPLPYLNHLAAFETPGVGPVS